MFRRLFAIETAALQSGIEDAPSRQDQPAHPLGDSLRDFARLASGPSCHGMWSARIPA